MPCKSTLCKSRETGTAHGLLGQLAQLAAAIAEHGHQALAFALAPEDAVTLDRRAIRPLPPGRVQGNGSYAPNADALVIGPLALTWTHRDRLTQTSPVIVDHTGASIGPEPGVSYIIEVRWIDPDTGAVTIDRYYTCDDVGRVINPMIVAGQVHGGMPADFKTADHGLTKLKVANLRLFNFTVAVQHGQHTECHRGQRVDQQPPARFAGALAPSDCGSI